MKKYAGILLMSIMLFMLTACGASKTETADQNAASPAPAASAEQPEADNTDQLILYFSWSGNTRAVAEEISSQTGADIFEIIPETPYSDDYNEVLDTAQREQSENARPVISGAIDDFNKYTTIFVGYPNWWGDMPMIMYSLFDDYDFTGKTIAPFVTSGGSGFSGTIDTIRSLEPGAEVTEGLSLSGDSAENSAADVSKWLTTIE